MTRMRNYIVDKGVTPVNLKSVLIGVLSKLNSELLHSIDSSAMNRERSNEFLSVSLTHDQIPMTLKYISDSLTYSSYDIACTSAALQPVLSVS